jgi:hypothetical protein
MFKMQALLRNCDQHVGACGDADLGLHGVLARAKKRFDSQVLLGLIEEQFDLSALLVQRSDQFWLEGEIVGQKHDVFARFVAHHHTTQRRWIVFARIENRQYPSLVLQHRRVGPIHRLGVTSLGLGIALAAMSHHTSGEGAQWQ